MRIGIISDVHSNANALKAVLKEFDNRGVEKIICLGDFIGLGARPEECVKLIQSRQNQLLAAVRGNHEKYLLEALPVYSHNKKTYPKIPQEILDLFRWNHSMLSPESVEFLRQLPLETVVKVAGHKIFVCHYPVDVSGTYREFFFRPNSTQCKKMFAGKTGDIFLFGHTHIRCVTKTRDGILYINPGSVGCPIGTEAASVGILDIDQDQVEYHQYDVVYDVDITIDDMLQHSKELPAINETVNSFYRNLG